MNDHGARLRSRPQSRAISEGPDCSPATLNYSRCERTFTSPGPWPLMCAVNFGTTGVGGGGGPPLRGGILGPPVPNLNFSPKRSSKRPGARGVVVQTRCPTSSQLVPILSSSAFVLRRVQLAAHGCYSALTHQLFSSQSAVHLIWRPLSERSASSISERQRWRFSRSMM